MPPGRCCLSMQQKVIISNKGEEKMVKNAAGQDVILTDTLELPGVVP